MILMAASLRSYLETRWSSIYFNKFLKIFFWHVYISALSVVLVYLASSETSTNMIISRSLHLCASTSFLFANTIYSSFTIQPRERLSDEWFPTFVRYPFISACGYILKSSYIYFYRHYAKCERSATRPDSQAYCSFNHATGIVLLFLLFPFHFHYGGRKKCSTIIRAVKYDTFPPRTLVFQF